MNQLAGKKDPAKDNAVKEGSIRAKSLSPVKRSPVRREPRSLPETRPSDGVAFLQTLKDKRDIAIAELKSERQQHAHTRSELDAAEYGLKSEKKQHAHTKSELEKQIREFSQLQAQSEEMSRGKDQDIIALTQHANRIEAIQQKKDEELEDIKRRWRETASSLNKFLAQGQGFSQLTDEELIQKVKQLRFKIRNLMEQQFGSENVDPKNFYYFRKAFARYFEMPNKIFETSMRSPSKRPVMVGAFIWAFLQDDVFGKFRWAGTRISNAISPLTEILETFANDDSTSGVDAKRKYQTWRASTANLIVEAMGLDKGVDHGTNGKLNKSKIKHIVDCLALFSKSKPKELDEYLFNILDDALNLDKMISKQAAEIQWVSDMNRESRKFNPNLMELQTGEKLPDDDNDPVVWLILAPGMVKRGKSTGEDLQLETLVLKTEVSCESASSQYEKVEKGSAGQSNKSWFKWSRDKGSAT